MIRIHRELLADKLHKYCELYRPSEPKNFCSTVLKIKCFVTLHQHYVLNICYWFLVQVRALFGAVGTGSVLSVAPTLIATMVCRSDVFPEPTIRNDRRHGLIHFHGRRDFPPRTLQHQSRYLLFRYDYVPDAYRVEALLWNGTFQSRHACERRRAAAGMARVACALLCGRLRCAWKRSKPC